MEPKRREAAGTWRVHLLGGLRVERDGRAPITRFETRRAASLIAFLACHRNRSHPRERLMEMLWPDEDPEATRLRFRQVLATLRRTLENGGEEPVLLSDRAFVWLDAGRVTTDVHAFEDALTAAGRAGTPDAKVEHLRRAVGLYTGDLLAGFADEWVGAERDRLREVFLAALDELAEGLAAAGDAAGALQISRRTVALDPLREESQYRLIRLYAASGRPAEALRQYREMEQVLWKELRAVPSPEAQALTEALRTNGGRAATMPRAERPTPQGPPEPPSTALGNENDFARTAAATDAGSLPPAAALTRFFGREEEITHLVSLLNPGVPATEATRLVTLVGPGGCGKTRLALEVARALSEPYRGAFHFVSLADMTEPDRIGVAIAAAVGVMPSPVSSDSLLEEAVSSLGDDPVLLVLDNLEGISDATRAPVRTLLRRAPALRCLVTSRSRLDVEGEQEYEVPPLPTPGLDADRASLVASSSVQMFLDRARKVRPGLDLTEANAASLARLCHRLEGIPLAIELAAAWAAVLTPAEMLDRLSQQRFDFLISRRREQDPRQQSLRQTLAWSYRRLGPEAQPFFARLSVLRGSWTLEAAEAVAGSESAFDYLARLRQYSLLSAVETPAGMRFSLLETVREFASEMLPVDERAESARRHAEYFVAFAERAGAFLTGPDQEVWGERIQADLDNVRASLEWCAAAPDGTEPGLRLTAALWRFWDARCLYAEGEQWLGRFLARSVDSSSRLRAKAVLAAGNLASVRGQHGEARTHFEEALSVARNLGDDAVVARALCGIGESRGGAGEAAEDTRELFEASRAIFARLGDSHGVARALGGEALVALRAGDFEAAGCLYDKSAAMYRIAGHKKGMAWSILMQGCVAMERGTQALSQRRLEEALSLFRALDDRMATMHAISNLGLLAVKREDWSAAARFNGEAVALARQAHSPEWEAEHEFRRGEVAERQGDILVSLARYRAGFAIVRVHCPTLDVTLPLERLARLMLRAGEGKDATGRAVSLLGFVDALRAAAGADRHMLSDVRAALGESSFGGAWEEGRAMTFDEALRLAAEAG